MTRDELVRRLTTLLGQHDQTARCEAIKAIVEYESGTADGARPSDTERFVALMIRRYNVGIVADIANLNNRAMTEIGDHLATHSPAYRARVIERLSSMIGAIAEIDAKSLSEAGV